MAYSTISKPSLHFNTKLTTGTGNSQAVTGLGFQPDLIWGKRRDSTGQHSWFDAVRGITKGIESSTNAVEFTTTDYYSSFDSDGFTIAAGSGGAGNGSSQTAAQWCWKGNGAGSANTAGDINSTVSVNTTAGFSIVKYTGSGSVATIGHGLGVAPKLIIVKRLTGGTEAWPVNCRAVSGTMYLNETGTLQSYGNSSPFPSDAPTSTLFYVGSSNNANASGSNFIAYCFAEKKGYSKLGSYKGNGNADGTFVYTGFKPAWIMIKCTSSGSTNWQMYDNKREGYNPQNDLFRANLNSAEGNGTDPIDIYSNGFKNRHTASSQNASGDTYTYMAFAAEPLVANVGQSIPATAR